MSTDLVLPAAEEDEEEFSIEVRDCRGIPYIIGRVRAKGGGDALTKVSAIDTEIDWVFLREMTRAEIAQCEGDRFGAELPGTTDGPDGRPVAAECSSLPTVEHSTTGILSGESEVVA